MKETNSLDEQIFVPPTFYFNRDESRKHELKRDVYRRLYDIPGLNIFDFF